MAFAPKNVLSAVLLSVAAVSCDDVPWWKTAVVYQVYPRSFKDSDGDGIGDLKGIIEKADYFKDIGVDAIWLSPIYKSPMVDMGYDVSNFTEIDSIFGTMLDFENLIVKMKSLGIRVLMDFVPNHCSDQHPWFQSAINKSDPHHEDYKDFFVWREARGWNGTTPLPPTNWDSLFQGSAWEWNEDLQLFYLHQFKKQQPDLNYRNPKVVGNMTDVMTFWMDKGVSGFRVDAVAHLFENNSFPDQPAVPGTKGDTFFTQQHNYTMHQPETFDLVWKWTDFVRELNDQKMVNRCLILEVYGATSIVMMKYYGEGERSITFPFNLLLLQGSYGTKYTADRILSWTTAMPQGAVSSWVVGNHDVERVADRQVPEMVDAMNLLSGVLPGMKVVYYGEEIGMEDTKLTDEESIDKSMYHSDAFRTPMQWDDSINSGLFTDYFIFRSAQNSHLKVFQEMTKARKDPVLKYGDLNLLAPDNQTLVVIRSYNTTYFALVINNGSDTRTYTSQYLFDTNVANIDMTVVVGSINSGLQQGSILRQGFTQLTLRPKSAVLLRSSTSPTSSALITLPLKNLLLLVILLLTVSRLIHA